MKKKENRAVERDQENKQTSTQRIYAEAKDVLFVNT